MFCTDCNEFIGSVDELVNHDCPINHDTCDAHLLGVQCDGTYGERTTNGRFHVRCHDEWWSRKRAARRTDWVAEDYFAAYR